MFIQYIALHIQYIALHVNWCIN